MRVIGVAILTLILSIPASATSWSEQLAAAYRSIVALEVTLSTETGICTAFSIDEKKSTYLTAAHCYGEEMKLNGEVVAGIIFYDNAQDIMVLQAMTPYKRPALHPRALPYMAGLEVAAIGYGRSYNQPMIRAGILSIFMLDSTDFGHRLMNIYDFSFVNGMSGGPIIDIDGRVVGIVNSSYRDATMGAGRPLEALRKAAPSWK